MSLNTNTTGTSGLNDASAIFYDRVLLEFLKLPLFMLESAEKRKLPAKNGTQIQFLRPKVQSVATTPLTEGTVGNGLTYQSTKILSTPLQYGGFVATSDRLLLEAYDDITKAIMEVLGYQAGQTIDTLILNALEGNMVTQFTGTANSEITTSVACAAVDFRKAAAQLRSLAVMPFNDGKSSAFHAVIHPVTAADLQADSAAGGWLDVNRYMSIPGVHEDVLAGEIGKLYGVRFQESANIPTGTGASSAVTYHNWVMGRQAFGAVDVADTGIQKIVHQPGEAGSQDPLNQIGSIGWKTYFSSPILASDRAIEVIGTSAYLAQTLPGS
jgi:N4-gp56 family major capsid protein